MKTSVTLDGKCQELVTKVSQQADQLELKCSIHFFYYKQAQRLCLIFQCSLYLIKRKIFVRYKVKDEFCIFPSFHDQFTSSEIITNRFYNFPTVVFIYVAFNTTFWQIYSLAFFGCMLNIVLVVFKSFMLPLSNNNNFDNIIHLIKRNVFDLWNMKRGTSFVLFFVSNLPLPQPPCPGQFRLYFKNSFLYIRFKGKYL